jgi:apolipoprotein N-acyltransferase
VGVELARIAARYTRRARREGIRAVDTSQFLSPWFFVNVVALALNSSWCGIFLGIGHFWFAVAMLVFIFIGIFGIYTGAVSALEKQKESIYKTLDIKEL